MILEIFVLALASTIRPTSLAAVCALLSHDSRRTLLWAYVAAGLAFTIGFGLLVVFAFHGIHIEAGADRTKGIADIVGGAVAVTFGIAILTGHVRSHDAGDAPRVSTGRKALVNQHLTLRTAALAGPLTHLPGLFYLIALNVIVAHDPRVPRGLLAVATYNAIWFALPIVALAACIVRPAEAVAIVGSIERWARDHSRAVLLVVSLVVGTALVVRGVLTI
ncbi:GAP family protein [Conexibacter stalactiti]|uniref:GAP family protein n=1 Tax=Conexibacter stalactiti TaxID=1940611 RepID=A0ABU4HNZ3_9ACTN|nr:GAP family protein [Conexibacter stalactiti]MDW5594260.1 GAP family protein [Conexibacter stalactiti]MEC5034902.1 GAP family protein [Conexibacter stalactiti]